MTRYREAIRADLLHEYGVDLAAWWKARRWVGLLDLIDQLPTASRLSAAMLDDPEVTEAMAARKQTDEWSPPVSEYNLVAMLLAEIRDRQGEIINAVLSTIPVEKGKTRPKHRDKPFPRPVTEIDRAKRRASEHAYLDIVRTFAPHALN